jgi:hypothetical protein
MYKDFVPDLSPTDWKTPWTVVLIQGNREVHFGIFTTLADAVEAMDSGKIRVGENDRLTCRQIREFPS